MSRHVGKHLLECQKQIVPLLGIERTIRLRFLDFKPAPNRSRLQKFLGIAAQITAQRISRVMARIDGPNDFVQRGYQIAASLHDPRQCQIGCRRKSPGR